MYSLKMKLFFKVTFGPFGTYFNLSYQEHIIALIFSS